MIPVTQFILGNSDPLLYPSEKMTNSIDEQIAFLQSQNKQLMKLIVVMLFLMQIMVQFKISKL